MSEVLGTSMKFRVAWVDLAPWAHQVDLETWHLVHEAATMKYLFTPITFQNTFSNSLPAKSDRLGKYVFL